MSFYATYKPAQAKALLQPAPHQQEALANLSKWWERKDVDGAGLLVVPTGGGKTFTAVRFLCSGPIADGYKVIWLAHTHHLLEQAYEAFGEGAKALAGSSKKQLTVRVTSGYPGHWTPGHCSPDDDVLIGTLQTVRRAWEKNVPAIKKFVEQSDGKLFIVFDEAHHTPARTFRRLIQDLREAAPKSRLLGLTATPTYTDQRKRGWLSAIYSDGFLYQADVGKLFAAGVLARPRIETVETKLDVSVDDETASRWFRTNSDVPENIVSQLAKNEKRNLAIVGHYLANKDRYGKTIIFADRWAQCLFIEEKLNDAGVRAGSVFSKIDASLMTVAQRNAVTRSSNAQTIAEFKEGKLDVVINIRMLTEGTDVPDAQTVFLTRQTTSQILMTQMVGRVLRGPKFGGTETGNIVSFVDQWQHLIQWAGFENVIGELVDDAAARRERAPMELISIDLVRRLIRRMDGIDVAPLPPFQEMLPAGWYRVDFSVALSEDEIDHRSQLLMVYDHEHEAFERLIEAIRKAPLDALADEAFESDDGAREKATQSLHDLVDLHLGEEASNDARIRAEAIARHVSQRGVPPAFYRFDLRDKHDLDVLAAAFVHQRLDPFAIMEAARKEYDQSDLLWSTLFRSFHRFKFALDGAVNRKLLGPVDTGPLPPGPSVPIPDREPSEQLKAEVLDRDRVCLACGAPEREFLQVDHVRPYYLGGLSELDNLQALCKFCNQLKSDRHINFRDNTCDLRTPPPELALEEMQESTSESYWTEYLRKTLNFFYECAAVRTVNAGRGRKTWEVVLYSGNDGSWISPFLAQLRDSIQSAHPQALPTKLTVIDGTGARYTS